MPNITEANAAIADNSGLAAQILDDDAQAYESFVEGGKTEESDKQDVAEAPPSPGEGEDKGQVETPDEKPSDESAQSEEPTPEPGKEPKPEDQNATLKIGDREFATIPDAIEEMNRINGRNAQLAGDLRDTEEVVTTLKGEVETTKSELQRVIEVNQQWQAWYEKTKAGDPATPPANQGLSVEEIVAKALVASKAQDARAVAEANARAEYESVRNAPNYHDVRATIYKIADRVNPLTGEEFTPMEAYDFACKALGVENLLSKKAETTPKPAIPTPKSPVNPALKQQAARPANVPARPKAAEKAQLDDVDESLGRAFPKFR